MTPEFTTPEFTAPELTGAAECTRAAPLGRTPKQRPGWRHLAVWFFVTTCILPGCTDDAGGTRAEKNAERPAAASGAQPATDPPPSVSTPLTYTKDIAPIVLDNCATCHRPGQSAPFPLLTYSDVKRHARQIVEVTDSGFMPPWLPVAGFGEFDQERRLTDLEIQRIARWVANGTLEGDAAHHPPIPEWPEGWQIGEPDLVVELQEPYPLVADGPDVFRNFVIPISLQERRYVRSVEFRPLTPAAVHHAVLYVDTTRSSRRLDAEDEEPGYGGMYGRGNARVPRGHLLGWTPGKVPYLEPAEHAWSLDPGTDLVLQAHMVPTGKVEQVGFQLGLYFGTEPPTRQPTMVRVGSKTIDIPAGDAQYVLEDSIELPIATQILGIYPHAHYLGKTMEAHAALPDGSRKPLLRIDDWDFNWQDSYRYRQPIDLPAGTKLHMKYVFDNSATNLRNPSSPPVDVRYGPQSKDEMGDLWVQILPVDPRQARRLDRAVEEHERRDQLAYVEKEFRDFPDDAVAVHNQAVVLRDSNQSAAALPLFRKAVALDPDFAEGHYNLAKALTAAGLRGEATAHYVLAIKAYPNFVEARNNLGYILASQKAYDTAIYHYREALKIAPQHVVVRANLALALRGQGKKAEAISELIELIRLRPNSPEAQQHLADTYYLNQQPEKALDAYRRVLKLVPGSASAYNGIAGCLLWQGDVDGAIVNFRKAIELRPNLAATHRNLARALDKKGLSVEAQQHRETAARLDKKP